MSTVTGRSPDARSVASVVTVSGAPSLTGPAGSFNDPEDIGRADTGAPTDWQITWRGKTWTDDDLTIGHVAVIVEAQGLDRWDVLDPFAGPVKLLGVLAALIAVDQQRPVNSVTAELAHAHAWELLAALSTGDDGDGAGVAAVVTDPGPDPVLAEAVA